MEREFNNVGWACSLAGRALHSHCRGQGFESPQVHYIGHEASQLLGLRGEKKRAAMGDERVGEEPSERRAASARAEARATCSRVPEHKRMK